MRPVRIGMVGGFDVGNFGDLLFPYLAEHELGARLGRLQLTLYAYRPMRPPAWVHATRPLSQLVDEVPDFDLLVIGGGQIARWDRGVGAGYRPTDPLTHHPLGLWLTPTLVAAAAGVPVAWNALGVSPGIPDWLSPLVEAALDACTYVSVRDDASAERLAVHGDPGRIRVTPDSAFGAGWMLDGQKPAWLTERLDPAARYVIVQPAPELVPHAAEVGRLAGQARDAGFAVLELPISPVHGDRAGLLELGVPTISPPGWPSPPELARVIAGADAVVAQSYHLSIVAAVAGVAVHRPPSPVGWKFEALEPLRRVHLLDGGAGRLDCGRDAPEVMVAERAAQVAAHWDTIAAAARTTGRGPREVARLLARLPAHLEALAERPSTGAAPPPP
jgi:lipopolysaccharide transport system ATP-binding protein